MILYYYEDDKIALTHLRDEHPDPDYFDMHAHEYYELLYFVAGDASMWVEGANYPLRPRDLMVFNIAETHSIVINSDRPYERIILQIKSKLFSSIDPEHKLFIPFTSRGLGESNRLRPEDFEDTYWETCIKKMLTPDKAKSLQFMANVPALLNELRCAFEHTDSGRASTEDNLPSRIINYINTNISEDLTPDKIAAKFYISRSKLYALFRETTGSTIWKYITVKRLLIAKELLQRGEKPMDVYLKCGFHDYTAFFKAYKAKFGISPKQDTK